MKNNQHVARKRTNNNKTELIKKIKKYLEVTEN